MYKTFVLFILIYVCTPSFIMLSRKIFFPAFHYVLSFLSCAYISSPSYAVHTYILWIVLLSLFQFFICLQLHILNLETFKNLKRDFWKPKTIGNSCVGCRFGHYSIFFIVFGTCGPSLGFDFTIISNFLHQEPFGFLDK